ncbi:CoA transferase, partial [Rhizobiaceae sp. 2RAB30]
AKHDKQHLFNLFMDHRVPCAPVRTLDEVVNDPHLHERGSLEWVDHPIYGRVALMRSPLRFHGQSQVELKPSGELGRDNHGVYGDWLGIDSGEIEDLKSEGII